MIACICPTTRDRNSIYQEFFRTWKDLFEHYAVELITIYDGDDQYLETSDGHRIDAEELLGEDSDLISKKDTACKNLGLYYVLSRTNYDRILILDDDTRPLGDTISAHMNQLDRKVPISWVSTMSEYPRGFPYGLRDEAEVVISHGVWEGVPDWDAPTQLVMGNRSVTFPQIVIPKHAYFPMCGMNLMVKRKAIPYLYFAPPWKEMGRCDDIFAGVVMKNELDKENLAAVSGFATVKHERASNVFKNLQKEALFIELNETFWQGNTTHPYFSSYLEKYTRWKKRTLPLV